MSLKNAIKILFGSKSGPIKTIRIGALDELATKKFSRKNQTSEILDIPLDEIDVNPEYAQAIDYIQSDCPIIFITGKAGTGKSTFIQYLRATTKKNLAVVAPTGVAAINAHGQTIHSLFHFPPRPLNKEDVKQLRDRTLFEKLDLLIVDEISMVRADLLDAIELSLRINTGNSDKPFGGVQVVFVGDLFQLPPVVARKEEARLFGGNYTSRYFFSAHCLKDQHTAFIELNKVYRQESKHFIDLLTAIREEEEHESAIDELNNACLDNKDRSKNNITLTCTNAVAGRINHNRLQSLQGNEYVFQARVTGQFRIRDKMPSPYELHLKSGAQVMFTKNDSQKRWVNGTLGLIKNISNDNIQVETHPGRQLYNVPRVSWENLKFKFDLIEGKVIAKKIGEYIQFPLMLAWAVTIHKAQGKTLDNVLVDLGTGAFDFGQVYVALSRCSSLAGITLKRPIRLNDVRCDPVVKEFYLLLREVAGADDKNIDQQENLESVRQPVVLVNRGSQFVDEFQRIDIDLNEEEIFPFIRKFNEVKRSIGKPPEEFLNGKTANPHNVQSFELSKYLNAFDRISIHDDYVLDYVYAFDGNGGEPLIYAREMNEKPLASPKEYYNKYSLSRPKMLLGQEPTHEDSRPYLSYLQFENTPLGFFQFAILCMTIRRFYLFWHSNYNDRKYILTKAGLKSSFENRTRGISLHDIEILKTVKINPRIKIMDNLAQVTVLNFELNMGYSYLHIYLSHPNIFKKFEDECIIKSKITVLY